MPPAARQRRPARPRRLGRRSGVGQAGSGRPERIARDRLPRERAGSDNAPCPPLQARRSTEAAGSAGRHPMALVDNSPDAPLRKIPPDVTPPASGRAILVGPAYSDGVSGDRRPGGGVRRLAADGVQHRRLPARFARRAARLPPAARRLLLPGSNLRSTCGLSDPGELLALVLAEQAAQQYLGTPVGEPLRRAVQKSAWSMPDAATSPPWPRRSASPAVAASECRRC